MCSAWVNGPSCGHLGWLFTLLKCWLNFDVCGQMLVVKGRSSEQNENAQVTIWNNNVFSKKKLWTPIWNKKKQCGGVSAVFVSLPVSEVMISFLSHFAVSVVWDWSGPCLGKTTAAWIVALFAPSTLDATREAKQTRMRSSLFLQFCSHCTCRAMHDATRIRMGSISRLASSVDGAFWCLNSKNVECLVSDVKTTGTHLPEVGEWSAKKQTCYGESAWVPNKIRNKAFIKMPSMSSVCGNVRFPSAKSIWEWASSL